MFRKYKNFGLLNEKYPKNTHYLYGGTTPVAGEVLQWDGKWDKYVPEEELQHGRFFDTMGCVTFSALNCIEMIMNNKYNKYNNFSDRYIVTLSDTNPKKGNYLYKVGDAIGKYGLILEEDYPFDRQNMKQAEYYKDPVKEMIDDGVDWLKYYKVNYEFVSTDHTILKAAMKEAPLQITILYSTKDDNNDGILERRNGTPNHAVTLYSYSDGRYWDIYDHYRKVKKRLAWDYYMGTALKYSITLKENYMPNKFPNNTLLKLVENEGGVALYLDGSKLIYKNDTSAIIEFMARNDGNIKERIVSLSQKNWDDIPTIQI